MENASAINFPVLHVCGADPGERELLYVSQLKIESPQQASKDSMMAAVDTLINQDGFHFSATEYRKRCGFSERHDRWETDLKKPVYDNLRQFNQSGQPARGSNLEQYKTHVEGFAKVFGGICSINLCRNRVAARFRVKRKTQSTMDKMANDTMRGMNTADHRRQYSDRMRKATPEEKVILRKDEKSSIPPRKDTILFVGASMQVCVIHFPSFRLYFCSC